MVRLWIILTLSMCSVLSNANMDISGDWQGELKVQEGMVLPLVLHLSKTGDTYQATLDSPSQGATNIPVNLVTFDAPDLMLDIQAIGAKYEGTVSSEKIEGTFSQMGRSFPLTLMRQTSTQAKANKDAMARPQEPEPPYPYHVEEVTVTHISEDFSLAGTLTLPDDEGPFPAEILITGSGPQDRDETLAGHKPFKVIADYLTRQGIAVLRADDRGVAGSGGTFEGATLEDFATDVASLYQYLSDRSDIETDQIGLIGHSEGGMTGPLFAMEQDNVAWMVLLAAPGVSGREVWLTQQRDFAEAYGAPDPDAAYSVMAKALELAEKDHSEDEVFAFLIAQGLPEQSARMNARSMTGPWGSSFLRYDPAAVLPTLSMPVLAVYGEKDSQVAAMPNAKGIQDLYKKSNNALLTVKTQPALNHLFQHAESGLPDEYARITETFDEATLALMAEWILRQQP